MSEPPLPPLPFIVISYPGAQPQFWMKTEKTLYLISLDFKLFDAELRSFTERRGSTEIAWLPVRCRNGKVRWLCSVEKHSDGTYTKARKEHERQTTGFMHYRK